MIPITMPVLGEEEAAAVKEVIFSGWVVQGPKVKQFEKDFASYVNSKYACAVSSCTTALHLSLLAIGVKPGDVVITVSHSFIATANAVRYCGAEPLFVDIDPATYNIDVEMLSRFLEQDCVLKNNELYYRYVKQIAVGESPLQYMASSGRIAAILAVHQMGMPCEIESIVKLAKQYHLPVIEDAACALGSEIFVTHKNTWEKIGKPHGDIACFSFHPRKLLTTGEGGMITSNSVEIDTYCRLLRQHGMSVPANLRHESEKIIFENYATTGFNYRMTDIQAAIGIEQLKKLCHIIKDRRQLASQYADALSDIPCLKLPQTNPRMNPNWQSYPVRLLKTAPCSQIECMQYLRNQGIATGRGIMNAHQEAPFAEARWNLPQSKLGCEHTILLPLFSGMDMRTFTMIIKALHKVLHYG